MPGAAVSAQVAPAPQGWAVHSSMFSQSVVGPLLTPSAAVALLYPAEQTLV